MAKTRPCGNRRRLVAQAQRRCLLLACLFLACQALLAPGPGAQQPPTASKPSPRPADKASKRLWDLLPQKSAETRQTAFQRIQATPDLRDLAPLSDLLRVAQTRDEWFLLLDALQPHFPEDLRQARGVWRLVTQRIGDRIRKGGIPRHPDYARWKGKLLAQTIDPDFERFPWKNMSARVPVEEFVWGGVGVDGIPSLNNPGSVAAGDATWLQPWDPVLAVAWGGTAKAYPLRIMDWHEMVNDQLAGVPFALSWCTLCGAAVAYRAEYPGPKGQPATRLEFGSSGLLMRSNKLMFDRGTHTLWNQLTGQPLAGELVGRFDTLEVLPVVVTTWGAWRARHPGTTTIPIATGHDRDYTPGASYGAYFASSRSMFPVPDLPATDAQGGEAPLGKLRDKEKCFVVRAGGRPIAIPLREITESGSKVVAVEGARVLLLGPRAEATRVPRAWRKALGDDMPSRLGDWTPAQAVAALSDPALLGTVTPDALLGLSPEARTLVLQTYAPEGEDQAPKLPRAVRDQVAVRAMVAPVRGYQLGQDMDRKTWTWNPATNQLVDGHGGAWQVTEDALVGPSGQELPRVPGHLAFGLAVRGFLDGPR